MRLLISILVITAAVLGGVSVASAGLAFQLDRTFTIPGLSGTIQQMKFNDIDGDGVPEVLACTSAKVVLYSISGDSTVFTTLPDAGYVVKGIELADVNRDSVPDITIAFMRFLDSIIFTPMKVFYAQRIVTKSYFGPEYSTPVTDSMTGSTGAYTPFGTIAAADVNSDGYNELLVSLSDVSVMEFMVVWSYWEEGKTVCYRSFPNEVLWSTSDHITGLRELRRTNEAPIILARRYYDSFTELGADWGTTYSDICALGSGGTLQPLPGIFLLNTCSDNGRDGWGNEVLCSGELDLDSTNDEVLLSQYYFSKCGYDGPEIQVDSLQMYHFVPPATYTVVWSKDYSAQNYGNFVYHPGLPGYFFAFSADTLVLFRGVNGSVHSKLTDVPLGTRYWDYPYSDGIPRLVATNGTQVSLYQLDVATSVEDEPGGSVPGSFALSQPFPNPFNAELTIPINLPRAEEVTVDVFNIVGEHVARLHEGKSAAGENRVRWDATGVSSGIYLIRAQTTGETRTVKAVLLK